MSAFHVGAVAAFFYIDTGAILAAVLLWWISGSLGIGMGYHRLLTHRGYKTPKWMEYFLTTCGTLALEGGPIFWVATHRIHHQHSDKDGDPHTPREGHLLGPHGLDPVRQGDAPRHLGAEALRARPEQGPLPRRAHHLALGAAGGRRPRPARLRRPALRAVGHGAAHHLRPALHLAGQLGHPPVGLAPLPHQATTRPTTGGWRSSASARAGTTTTTPTRCRCATAWPGTSST